MEVAIAATVVVVVLIVGEGDGSNSSIMDGGDGDCGVDANPLTAASTPPPSLVMCSLFLHPLLSISFHCLFLSCSHVTLLTPPPPTTSFLIIADVVTNVAVAVVVVGSVWGIGCADEGHN